MAYRYKMLQFPPSIVVKGAAKGQEAAAYLEQLANHHAADGWEFYRVDTVGVITEPGCLAALLGAKQSVIDYYVMTLRKSV